MKTYRDTVTQHQHLISLNAFFCLFVFNSQEMSHTLQDSAFHPQITMELHKSPTDFHGDIFASFSKAKGNMYSWECSHICAVILSQNVTVKMRMQSKKSFL